MKFIRVIKAYNKEYKEMVKDVANNFEKITGVPVEKLFNPPVEGLPLFDNTVVEKTFPKIKEYVLKKYNEDISTQSDFVYDLDDELTKFNPN